MLRPAFAFFLLVPTLAFAQVYGLNLGAGPGRPGRTIRIHLLEGKDYKPMKGIHVDVYAPFQPATKDNDSARLKVKKGGLVILHWNGQPPPNIWASDMGSPEDTSSCSQMTFCTNDILSHGVVAIDRCWRYYHPDPADKPPTIQATPGDLYIFAHNIGRWDYLKYQTTGRYYWPVFRQYYPDLSQCPPVPPLPGDDGDPSINRLARQMLDDAMAGKFDRSRFTPRLNAALTSAVIRMFAAQLGPAGPVRSFVYRGEAADRIPTGLTGLTDYIYRVTLATVQYDETLSLDAHGKIANLTLHPVRVP